MPSLAVVQMSLRMLVERVEALLPTSLSNFCVVVAKSAEMYGGCCQKSSLRRRNKNKCCLSKSTLEEVTPGAYLET